MRTRSSPATAGSRQRSSSASRASRRSGCPTSTEAQRRAYVIADNKLAQNAGWDRDVLAIELQALIDVEFDIELTGFSLAEVDILLDDAKESSPGAPAEGEDEVPPLPDQNSAVTRLGDMWLAWATPAHLRRLPKR